MCKWKRFGTKCTKLHKQPLCNQFFNKLTNVVEVALLVVLADVVEFSIGIGFGYLLFQI